MFQRQGLCLRLFSYLVIVLMAACSGDGGDPPVDDNEAPVANAGIDRTVQVNATVTLDGSLSTDDTAIETYTWTRLSGPNVTINNADSAQATFNAGAVVADIVFRLTVTDEDGVSDSDDVTIRVRLAPNEAPLANAGSNQSVQTGANVVLNGLLSSDDDGIDSYSWTQLSGTPVTINNANMGQASFTAPTVNNTDNLIFQLLVTDSDGATDTDDVTITVTTAPPPPPPANIPPQANAGSNQTVSTDSMVSLTAAASTDSDGNIVSYFWEQLVGPSVTLANPNMVQTTFTAPSFASSLQFRVTVTDDDGAQDTDTVTITIIAGIMPPVANAGADQTVDADSQVTLDGSGSSDSDGSIAAYNWVQTGGNSVTLSDNTVVNPTFTAPSENGNLFFQLTVTDNDGATDSDNVTITVTNGTAQVSGLDARPSNTTCLAPASPGSSPDDVDLTNPFPNLQALPGVGGANFPLGLFQLPNDNNFIYVMMRQGVIVRFANNSSVTSYTTVLDITGKVNYLGQFGEGGLLGMAFHPQVETNRAVYLSYTTTGANCGADGPNCSIISQFDLTTDTTIDPNSEQVLLRLRQPASNHNGGNIAFGPDGNLYIGFGDGGQSPSESQNTNSWYGSILRISVNPAAGTYTSPADNPFFSGGGLPEIYAYGLRNPYRWSFDFATNILWVGDVGQTDREEIDHIVSGANYGWPSMEGNICNIADCSAFVAPIHDYPRSVGGSITGGRVYRGVDFPELQGLYLFGDFASSIVYTLEDVGGSYSRNQVAFASSGVVSVNEDNNGELYVLTAGSPYIRKVTRPAAAPPGSNIPNLLSATGCFDAGDPTQPVPGLIPYDVVTPLWSDGAVKERWMALPNGETVDVDAQGDFNFPVGTILAKHFANNGTMIETRLLMLHQSGWAGYSYRWNGAQSDADLLSGAQDATVAGLQWHFPSGAECRQCHTSVKDFALGPEVLQLNNDFTYPQTGRSANQVFTLEAINVFTAPPDPSLDSATLFALDNQTATLEQRAKSYLHSNCSQCHQPGGTGGGGIDFRFETPFANMNLCNVVPNDNLGNANARNISPGNPNDSMVLIRMIASQNSGNRMPPLATRVQDTEATDLIRAWIIALAGPGCP